MHILRAQGDVEGALAVLRDVEQIVQTHHFQLATKIAFRTARVVQWLAVGDVQTASRWAEVCSGGSELEQIVLARVRLAQGRAADAFRLLDRQRALAEAGGRTGRSIEILGLLALALEAQGRPDEATAALAQALALARPEGYVRLFLDLGPSLRELLQRSARRGRVAPSPGSVAASSTGSYVHDLLEAFQREREAQRSRVAEEVSLPPPLAEVLLDPLRLTCPSVLLWLVAQSSRL
jgi:ATP/maltotriose-dependent transcriptional regulator MalT